MKWIMTQELHLRSPAGSEPAVYRWPLTLTVFDLKFYWNEIAML